MPAARVWTATPGPAGGLAVHEAPGASPAQAPASVLVLSHGFPVEAEAARRIPRNQPGFADRLAHQSGWRVLAVCLRGVEPSEGEFSLAGWFDDLGVLLGRALEAACGGGVWVAGEGTGGALALCLAGVDERVRGVACLGSPASFDDWAMDLPALAAVARRAGLVRADAAAFDLDAWAARLAELRPLEAAAALGRRPLLVIHGADDDVVPEADARDLVEANRRAGGGGELRVLAGAGHRLRSDPRAVAVLLGWLERQRP